MEKQQKTFEEELVFKIKEIEKYLTSEEKEEIYQTALSISKEKKDLDTLGKKVVEIEEIYKNVVNEYNDRSEYLYETMNKFNETIISIQKRVMKEFLSNYTTPVKLKKENMSKLNTEEVANALSEFIEGIMKQ